MVWPFIRWVTRGKTKSIVAAQARMNDSYLATKSRASKQHVTCQEIGHGFGLDHQSKDFDDNLNTCMDSWDELDNRSPIAHDEEMMNTIYAYGDGGRGSTPCRGKKCLESENTPRACTNAADFGELLSDSPAHTHYRCTEANGTLKLTDVHKVSPYIRLSPQLRVGDLSLCGIVILLQFAYLYQYTSTVFTVRNMNENPIHRKNE